MERITIEDFERHGFKVEILYKAVDDTEDDVIVLTKGPMYFKAELCPEGNYIMPLFGLDFPDSRGLKRTVWAEDVSDFSDLMFELAGEYREISQIYYRKKMLAKIIADELSKIGREAK